MYKLDATNMPTFESTAKAHESCPKDKLFHNDFRGWCTLHDEWWELPPQQGFDLNTLKEITLNGKQAVWLLNRDFADDDQWTLPENGETYQENVDLKIQIAVTASGGVRISTWE